MSKSMLKNVTFQKTGKIRKVGPRYDFEFKQSQRVSPDWWIFNARGPRGRRPSTRMRQRKRRASRKKEETRKKERLVVTRIQEGSEHARGQRPGEFITFLYVVVHTV